MPFCSQCGADVGGASFCPQCGAAAEVDAAAPPAAESTGSPPTSSGAGAAQPPPAAAAASGSQDNMMGALAYVTLVPAIIFLIIEPYKNIKFVRFHAFQMIFLCLAAFALWIAAMILAAILAFVPVLGAIIATLLFPIIWLGLFVLWIIAVLKAYQGEWYKLPVIGDLAEKQA